VSDTKEPENADEEANQQSGSQIAEGENINIQ
jgi:hypothetical protein